MVVDFSGYLEAICNNPRYTQWWKTYTVTDVVGKEILKVRSDDVMRSPDEVRSQKSEVRSDNVMRSLPGLLDLGLMVQTVPKKDERENREYEKEKIERFGVLDGLRKYAPNHVLLRGKPGTGKSTALVRLLLEDSDLARRQKAKVGESDYSLRRCRLWLQDLLDYHLLQRRGQDDIEFLHQLIQEYYTAETLVLEFDKITDEQLKWDYLNYLKWTETMAVVAGLLREEKQAVRLVKLGLAVDLQLSARLAGEVNDTFQGETVDLVKKLEIPALYKVELLGRTKSEEVISELEKALNDSDQYVRWKAASVLGNIGSDQAIESLSTFLLRGDWQYYNRSFSYILEALETIQDKCQIYQPRVLILLKAIAN